MRIAFLGTPDPAVPALRALVAAPDVEVVAVITNPDRPAGRGHKLRPPPVKVLAEQAGLPVWQPEKPRERLADLRALDVDACAVVAYGSLLPTDVLEAGGAGFVNLHFSLLPAWRGAAPVPASILAGDTRTGVTCFRIDAGMDTGDILNHSEARILPDETAGELTARLADMGGEVLVEAIRGLVDGSLVPQPQDHEQATYAPKVHADDARLDWTLDAAALDRAVRAYNPMPGAHTTFEGARLKVHRAVPLPGRSGTPGHVIDHVDGRPVVAAGQGALRLDVVQPAGKPRMDGRDFVNGYRPERLGS